MKKNNKDIKHIKDNKGNWEFSFFQKNTDLILESNIKQLLKPDNGFNPKNIYNYMNTKLSKEEEIIKKKDNGIKLKNNELIILNNYLKKNYENIQNDIKLINTYGLNASPITKEGKTRLLLKTLEEQLHKNNIDNIANIYLRLLETDKFELSDILKSEYNKELIYMNNIIKDIDLIELQFTKFHSQMPPLNDKGFKKLDDWQIKVINNIDNNISTIINAPTSAGKTVLSGYVATKGKVLYIVPTDALAWQMSAYIGSILDINIPILTDTYQTNSSRDNMIELLNKSNIIVGTTEIVVDYLPFINNKFNWLVCDEIHMIGKNEGSAMEYIIKLLKNVNILALSATIGNLDNFTLWLSSITNTNIDKIICNKRFYNFQKYYYNDNIDKLISIHPLGLIDNSTFIDKSILNKNIDSTPPNTWDLALKLKNKFNLLDLDPYIYFSINKRIELNDTNIYFNKLINFMINNYDNNIEEILNNYKQPQLKTTNFDLVKLLFNLKNNNKTPTIIFHKNTIACMKMMYELEKNINNLENIKYPKLFNERLKLIKNLKKIEKKNDESKTILQSKTKKTFKNMINNEDENNEELYCTSLQEPHEDFILNNNQYFNETIIESWVKQLKKYFPSTGEYYHFIIKLLWRGVGIYVKGLPDTYLRIVQSLASQKQLAFVISDESLVFGISMPFRSVIIINDDKYKDSLDSMLYHQMIGRAGRRGLDKEGNIIFAGFCWDRIKELSISIHPNIIGINKEIYSIDHANELSKLFNTNQNWNIINNNKLYNINNELILNDTLIPINLDFEFIIKNNINHLFMNWKFRYTNEGIIISYLLPFIKKAFDNKDYNLEIHQINIAQFLSRFISIRKADNKNNILEEIDLLKKEPYSNIINTLNNYNLNIINDIDNKIFKSIQNNCLILTDSEDENNELRTRLFEFGKKIQIIQHYFYYEKIVSLAKIISKLLTRIWWIFHSSSPIMKSLYQYEN